MKNRLRIFIAFISLALLLGIHTVSVAHPPPPPPGGHGNTGNTPPGGGAPVGEGMYFLLALAGIYGAHKIYQMKKAVSVE